jgi:cysteine synthase
MAIYDNLTTMIGNTPIVRIASNEADSPPIYLKLEGMNPTGSIKDRACSFMLSSALATSALRAGKVVLDASSGNFACSLAYQAKILGYPSEVVVSSKLTEEKRDFIEYCGAVIHDVGDFTIQGNKFCRELTKSFPNRYCFLDQLHNPKNPEAHFQTTGPEIFAEVPDVAAIVGSLGSGGTMHGVARFFKQTVPEVEIATVECSSGSRIPGTGSFSDGDYITPFIHEARRKQYFTRRFLVGEEDAIREVQLLMRQGIFVGLQTGGVVHAARACLRGPNNIRGPIVALSGDSGWKNLSKLQSCAR